MLVDYVYYSFSSSDEEDISRRRRSKRDQLAFYKRGLHQFVPKDIYFRKATLNIGLSLGKPSGRY